MTNEDDNYRRDPPNDSAPLKCPGEGVDMCCWCFPLKMGYKIQGIFSILVSLAMLAMLGNVYKILSSGVDYSLAFGLFALVGLLASLTACVYWVKMFQKNPNTQCDSDGSSYWRVDEDFVQYAQEACKWSLVAAVLLAVAQGFAVKILKSFADTLDPMSISAELTA